MAEISAQPLRETDRFALETLTIASERPAAGPSHWIVNDIRIGECSQLKHLVTDLPGALFANDGFTTTGKTLCRFSGLPFVTHLSQLTLVVTYVGPNPEGEPFAGVAFGRFSDARILDTFTVPIVSEPIHKRATVLIKPKMLTSFAMSDLQLFSADDWVIHDLRINGDSQLAQKTGVFGSAFENSRFNTCREGTAFEIDVEYVGEASSAQLKGAICVQKHSGFVIDEVDVEIQTLYRSITKVSCDARGSKKNTETK